LALDACTLLESLPLFVTSLPTVARVTPAEGVLDIPSFIYAVMAEPATNWPNDLVLDVSQSGGESTGDSADTFDLRGYASLEVAAALAVGKTVETSSASRASMFA
jgi:hypothetical protein